jgi:hypothetical protein
MWAIKSTFCNVWVLKIEDCCTSRVLLQHADRTFHDDAGNVKYHGTGYWVVNMDQNSPGTVKQLVPEMANMQLVDQDCLQQVYCGMPYLMPALSFIWYVY